MSSTQEVGEIFGVGSGPAHAMLRSPTVLIASVGLWGINVYFFRLFGINYVKVLKYDLQKEEEQEKLISNKRKRSESKKIKDDQSDDTSMGGNNNGTTMTTNTTGVTAVTGASSSSSSSAPPSGELMMMSSLNKEKDYYSDDDNDGSSMLMLNAAYPADETNTGGHSSLTEFGYDDDRNNNNDAEISWGRLVCFSLSLLVLLHSTYWIWIDVSGRNQLGAVFAFYGAVTTAIVIPFPSTKWLRKATVLVLQRSFELVNPRCNCVLLDGTTLPRAIPFVDVFFADAMCSLSKVFFDWGMLFHMASHYPNPVPKDASNILIPSAFAAVPFLIRARQCLIMYNLGRLTNDSKRFQHLANALKYFTSIFPLLLSAYQKTITNARSQRLEPLLILLLAINALYALYWDIVMDWGMLQHPTAVCATPTCAGMMPGAAMMTAIAGGSGGGPGSTAKYSMLASSVANNPNSLMSSSSSPSRSSVPRSCGHALMRPRLRFGVAMSAFIVMADSILRFSWTLRFYHKLFPSYDSFVLCTQFLEVFRRAIWNLLRVEWEYLKQKSGGVSSISGGIGGNGRAPTSSSMNRPDPPGSPNASMGATVITSGSCVGPVGSASAAGGGGGGVVSSAAELTSFITKKTTVKQATA